jgi:23S rRNA (cytidine1920-2'-O)/16S rRNA (cytidine1409-2'-O)-methyltransferase
VTVAGAPADKPARLVAAGESIALVGAPPRFVSRAGDKLDAALEQFDLDVRGACALDAGASTGGFTDCLLQRGASEVVAVDVGYGQLHERLRADPRVRNVERTNVRDLDAEMLGHLVDVVVADLSFISVRKVLDPLLGLGRPGALLVILVKPQFEAGRSEASRGKGVITDPSVWTRVLGEVMSALEERRAVIMGCMVSPVLGAEGNVEFLVVARTAGGDGSSTPAPEIDLDTVIRQATDRQRS